jgi:Tfp pilus assembly protein PilX
MTFMIRRILRDQRGIALLTTLLVAFAVSAIAFAAVMMTLNATLVGKNGERASIVDAAALAGLEEARSRLNGNKALYPTVGYTTLENNVGVKDASNTAIPKVTRSTYIGPTGIASGQYGIVGSIVSVARDSFGNQAVRRLEVNQESFSKFAYFTNSENDTTGATVVFGGGDQIRGPVFSNDQLKVYTTPTPAVHFFDQVSSAASSIQNQANGQFDKPPILNATKIPMPTVADLNKLDSLAQIGNTKFTGSTAGDAGEARTRIHFLTIDLGVANGGVQGFFEVYQGTDENFVSASLPTTTSTTGNYLELTKNCGDVANGTFMSAFYHDTTQANPDHKHGIVGTTNANKIARRDSSLVKSGGTGVNNPARTVGCYLGGDSILTAPGTGANWPSSGHADGGAWVQAPASIQAALAAVGAPITARPDANYLFPLARSWNPNFKGVISVAGKVIVDGVIHGRVTVAATGNIIFGDNVTYFQNPATRDCTTGDIAGYFSGQSLIVSNNLLNAPQTLSTDGSHLTTPSGTYRSYRANGTVTDETIHGFFLTLKTFGAEENNEGSNNAETCLDGGTFTAGRGCLETYGGIIQQNRGAVGLTSGQGYIKRYQYDPCGATDPPPYYPTTGIFVKNRFYEIDPTRFNVAAWYAANQN